MKTLLIALGLFSCFALVGGCAWTHPHHAIAKHAEECAPSPVMPKELCKVSLDTYVIEPPDILVVEVIRNMPKHPYALRAGDVIGVQVSGTPEDAPITGAFTVQPGGAIQLGVNYGAVNVGKMTVVEAQAEILKYLGDNYLKNPNVSVTLVEMSSKQQIAGQHLVGPDGTITLGSYGSVPLAGVTLAGAKQLIETHLSQYLEDPEVSVDIFGYNSKVYYVITEGGGLGDSVTRFPVTGNETVLDAIANVNGLTQVSSKKIWIARAVPHSQQTMILPVDWRARTTTNGGTTFQPTTSATWPASSRG